MAPVGDVPDMAWNETPDRPRHRSSLLRAPTTFDLKTLFSASNCPFFIAFFQKSNCLPWSDPWARLLITQTKGQQVVLHQFLSMAKFACHAGS
jgi:hypothetical protein